MTRTALLLLCLLAAPAAPAAAQPVADTVQLAVPGGILHGTLLRPAGAGPYPVALILAGSGPTDRDGNNPFGGHNDSLRKLAEGLAEHGVASIRFDKRGVAASIDAGPDEYDLRFDTYVDDAARWLRRLRADRRFSRVVVVGHSEGSLIGMIAARAGRAHGFVSLAGLGSRPGIVFRAQIRESSPSVASSADSIFTLLEAGQLVRRVPPDLEFVFRRSVQPYFISLLRRDPVREIVRLRVPVLLVQGTADIQVPADEVQLLARALPRARVLLLEGMNHILVEAPMDRAGNMATYNEPARPLAPGLVEAVAAFAAAGAR
ncbi:alpha/beta hydrolase [Longimicrobium sp.]|uniref:alpha/beta hydrolase n=1 Tax=Longimicrobium sp. TaxID=2029185 RepID=UPI002E37EE87|nr:alpha/beta fold hydrolase [Longimicrobium sp.]HEX6039368.1 alpha/beta fold hydrolase [Longimicrobium sp.]